MSGYDLVHVVAFIKGWTVQHIGTRVPQVLLQNTPASSAQPLRIGTRLAQLICTSISFFELSERVHWRLFSGTQAADGHSSYQEDIASLWTRREKQPCTLSFVLQAASLKK